MVVTHRLVLALVVVVMCMGGTLAAQADDSPYFVVFQTWGLATPPLETGLKVVTFLPRRYLLYIEDRDALEKPFDREYLRAVTQDGVEVLVDPGSVSRSTFRQRIGNHEVIFNSEFLLCKIPGCTQDDVSAWPIDRGDAFDIVVTENGFRRLEGLRDEPFQGYISIEQLDELKRRGHITRVDDSHPRYRVEKRRAATLATKCGEQRPAGNFYDLVPDDDATTAVVELLRIATVEDQRVKVTSGYGEPGRMYEFFSYHIEDLDHRDLDGERSADRFFHIAVAFKYACRARDLVGVTRDYIEVMTLASSRRDESVEININEFNTPRELRELTGSPYMISINKPRHFLGALEILNDKIADRTLAGYILTELNRSCPSEERANRQSKCLSYEYYPDARRE